MAISRALIDDPRLQFDTRAVATWFRSKPDGWHIRLVSLPFLLQQRAGPGERMGRDRVRRILRELEQAGYLVRARSKTRDGRWTWHIDFDDEPLAPTRRRLGRPKSSGGGRSRTLVGEFLARGVKVRSVTAKRSPSGSRKSAAFHRGSVAMRVRVRAPSTRSRRVTVKARIVNLKQAGTRSITTHLRYIERDGVTADGSPGQAYDANLDVADTAEFASRSEGDRHQFRFIVSPEDGVEIGDLREFTREVMTHMERDLGTRLEWVAADHWDTDNPHTHVVLRGKDAAGKVW